MSRTLNGNYIGQAAVTDRKQQRQQLYTQHRQVIEQAQVDFGSALDTLKGVDPNWEAWYDDDDNIPPVIVWGLRSQVDSIIAKISARVQALTASGG